MRDKLLKFMQGRYGVDALYRFLLLCVVLCTLLSTLLREHASLSSLFSGVSFLLIIWTIYRMFSSNIEKRYL